MHVAGVMADNEQHAAWHDGLGEMAEQDPTGSRRKVQELCRDEVVFSERRLAGEVKVQPVDLQAKLVRPVSRSFKCDGRDVGTRDPPAARGEPARVAPFAGASVDCRTWRTGDDVGT